MKSLVEPAPGRTKPASAARNSEKTTLRASGTGRLWALTVGQRLRYAAAIAAMGVGTVFLLLVPEVLQRALDALSAGEASVGGILIPAALTIVAFHAVHGFFTYLRGRWAAQASEGIVRQLRCRLYGHLEHLPSAYHDRADTGDLVQRCSSDVETVRVFMASQVVEIARVSLFLLVAVPIMLFQDLRMSAVSLALVPLIIFFAIRFFRQVRGLFKQVDESEGRLTTILQENLTGIRVVRAFARQEFEIEKFRQRNDEFRDLEFRLFMALSRYWALSDVLVFSQLGLALVGGGYLAVHGEISLGTWLQFWWMLRMIIWPVRHLGRVLADTGKATVAIGRIEEILSAPEEQSQGIRTEEVRGDIAIRDLTFSYGSGEPAIRKLSLDIAEGETVALLGPPGSGKSTLVNLLARLYDYGEGSIQIGGRELASLHRDAVRSAFGMVLQDPFLYSKTIRENVIIGRSSAADHEVEESTRAADIHENIVEFEQGYQTMVGERGVTLSGGQRQRLAIARALLRNPRFLVLDDSLSAVDTRTEAHILRALAERRSKRTTILIAHRLSSTRLADRIFLFADGELTQHGTHEELLDADGPYRELWRIQNSLELEIQGDLRG